MYFVGLQVPDGTRHLKKLQEENAAPNGNLRLCLEVEERSGKEEKIKKLSSHLFGFPIEGERKRKRKEKEEKINYFFLFLSLP